MKKHKQIALLLSSLVVGLTSCNFLDVAPTEIPTESAAFSNPRAAEGFLYSCYAHIPNPRSGAGSLDWFTGDEVVSAFEHESFANFPKGNFTAANPIISYWNTLFIGIKQCYILKNNISNVPGLEQTLKDDYIAQADFLIAYYHFLLARCYGPIIIVKEEPDLNTPPEAFLGRSHYDEGVRWIAEKLDDAAQRLPERRTGEQLGLATKTAALAIKSRLLLIAASPLFNGNPDYSNFRNKDGSEMISTTYDSNKWIEAKKAAKEAIDQAEVAGYRLYTANDANDQVLKEPTDPNQRAARFAIIDKNTPEIIWADTRYEGRYDVQTKSMPYYKNQVYNGIGLTLAMLDRFYTDKGLPITEDPDFDYNGRFGITTIPSGASYGDAGEQTSKMNVGREPRYYAWVAFHNGYYEIQGNATSGDAWAYYPSNKRGVDNLKLVTKFLRYDNCGRNDRTNNYSPSGFLNKKGVHPGTSVNDGGPSYRQYPWPVIRLAELYLNYAEACVETGDMNEAILYIDKVRTRSGVPTLQTAWSSSVTGIGALSNQNKMREIVRQERQIELYLENHNFWDMRRWKLAKEYFSVVPEGMNRNATSLTDFSVRTKLDISRSFLDFHYLLPIPYVETTKNNNLVQNPGY